MQKSNEAKLAELAGGGNYTGNMSKFFDFHKNQQQQQQQQNNQFLLNGHQSLAEQINMANLLDNNRLNSNFVDHQSGK